MQLLKANIQNFLILKNAEVSLDAQGLVLVLGYNQDGGKADSNGVGKSSIFEAICWGLYGQTYKGLKHDDVVSNSSKGGTKVEIVLKVKKDEIKVVRHRGHTKGKNKLHVYINGKNKTPFKQSDAELLLKSLLPLSFSAFKHVIYFGQKMGDTFLSLNDIGRKQLLEELIGIDIFGKAEKKVKQRLKAIKLEVSSLEGSEEAFKSSIASYETEIESLEESKEEEFKCLVADVVRLTNEKLKLEDARDEAIDKCDDLLDIRDVLKEQLKDAELQTAESREVYQTLKHSRRHSNGRVADQTDKIAKLMYLGGTCPTCEQEVDEQHKESVLVEMNSELDRLTKLLAEDIDGIAIAKVTCAEDLEMVEMIHTKMEALGISAAKLLIDRLELKQQQNKSELVFVRKQQGSVQESTEALRRTLNTTESNLAEVKDKLSVIYDELPYLEFWEKGFSVSGVRAMILDDVVVYLNSRMNHHSRAISDGEIAIELSSQTTLKSGQVRDKMSIVASTGGAGYIAASGGQQRRMDLAVHFALSDLTATITGHKMNLLVCDEVLDCIDESGTDAILDMLEAKAEAGMSVFLISHSDSLKNRIDSVLLATRNSGMSTVERIG